MKNSIPGLNGRSWVFLLGMLACCGALYVVFASVYLQGVVFLSEQFLQLIFNNLQLSLSPEQKLLLTPAPYVQVYITDDLFSVALNVIFPPALVIAILGLTRSGLSRALTSVGLMTLGHVFVVLCITLHFLATKGQVFIPTHELDPFSKFIDIAYVFYQSGMSDIFLPLLVWFVVCFRYITSLGYQPTGFSAAEPLKHSIPTKKKRKTGQRKKITRH